MDQESEISALRAELAELRRARAGDVVRQEIQWHTFRLVLDLLVTSGALARPLVLDPLWHLRARLEARDGPEFEMSASQVADTIRELSEAVGPGPSAGRKFAIVPPPET